MNLSTTQLCMLYIFMSAYYVISWLQKIWMFHIMLIHQLLIHHVDLLLGYMQQIVQ